MVKMPASNILLTLVLLQVRTFYAADLLDIPETNIWQYEESDPTDSAAQILSTLCENYHIVFRNRNLPCEEIRLEPLPLDLNEQVIVKREVEDDELEGSGEDDVEKYPQHTNSPDLDPIDQKEQLKPEIEPYLNTNKSDSVNITPQEPTGEEKPQPSEAEASENAKNETVENTPFVDTSIVVLPPLVRQFESTQEEKQTTIESKTIKELKLSTDLSGEGKYVSNEHTVQTQKATVNVGETLTTVIPKENQDENKDQDASPNLDKKGKDAEGSDEKGKATSVLPSDLVGVGSDKKKEKEFVDPIQSANAEVLLKEPQGVSPVSNVEGSDEKLLQKLSVNSEQSQGTKEADIEASTGESTGNIAKAGKDTTVLIVLFAVVLAVGGAAFAYNFVKKRKSGGRGTGNNLSHSSANGKSSDVEQGTELKPLMKNAEVKDGVKTDFVKS